MATYEEPPADVFAALRKDIKRLQEQIDAINARSYPTVPVYRFDNLPQDAIEGQIAIIENAPES